MIFRGSLLRKIQAGLIVAEGDGDGGGGGGSGDDKWSDGMPEAVREWDEVKNSDTADKFWDQMANQRSRMGRSITIPGEDAGDEDWNKFNTKVMTKVPTLMLKPDLENAETMDTIYGSLGRPEKHEDYTVPALKDEDNVDLDMSQAEALRPIAHAHGLNQKQFQGIVEDFTKVNVAEATAQHAEHVESHKGLKTEWGADYDTRMSIATNIAKLTDAPENIVKMLKEGNGTVSDYKWLYGIAQRFKGEGTNLGDDKNDIKVTMTPDEAQIKIDEIRNNKQHPFWKKTDPGHKAATKRMVELYKFKEGRPAQG